jgi:hypothetical protein
VDDIVRQAIAKWPNVPHCYGWLSLDARGSWRMRDERAQTLGLRGDRIANPALLGFISRNYTCDDQGRWYFQNGPQRVYVNLEATPYIARTDPAHGFMLHTGDGLSSIDNIWLTDAGHLVLQDGEKIAQLDDRDMAQCLGRLCIADTNAIDEDLMAWLEQRGGMGTLSFDHNGKRIAVQYIEQNAVPVHFGFVSKPEPDRS